jgi:hypothetical protein
MAAIELFVYLPKLPVSRLQDLQVCMGIIGTEVTIWFNNIGFARLITPGI